MTAVEVRAFRGTRQSSVYRSCVLSARSVERMRRLAARLRLAALAGVLESAERGRDDWPKAAARELATDVAALRRSAELLEVDDELAELAEIANWCSRAPKRAWLTVRRRDSA